MTRSERIAQSRATTVVAALDAKGAREINSATMPTGTGTTVVIFYAVPTANGITSAVLSLMPRGYQFYVPATNTNQMSDDVAFIQSL